MKDLITTAPWNLRPSSMGTEALLSALMANDVLTCDLPTPPGKILKLRQQYYLGQWWALTDKGWLWLDVRPGAAPIWMRSVYGPD